jgi:glucokinase
MRVLAGDVGGTKTLLGVFEGEPDALREVKSARFESAKYDGLGAVVRELLGDGVAGVEHAAFGIAGPIRDETVKTTNLPWEIDGRALARELGVARVRLLNDFEAVAHGIGALGPGELAVLRDVPADPDGPIAILGAGTGLGEAVVVPTSDGLRVLSSEGGHTDFAPRDELEIGLLRFLLERHDRVSVERVVSGAGLAAIYEFLVSRRIVPESENVRARIAREDPGAIIGELGLSGGDSACVRALDLFVSLYGAEAGNLALTVLPKGGLYVAGGIAPRILPALARGPFVASFLGKGRMRSVLETIRVSVVLEPRVGLRGAARVAMRERRAF